MIALYLLAAHLVGDFVFQTRWQAVKKFGWTLEAIYHRTMHCWSYSFAFAPILYWRLAAGDGFWRVAGFAWTLVAVHWLTDSRRFVSTLGDVIAWRYSEEGREARGRNKFRMLGGAYPDRPTGPPPNPWAPLPILIDQTLHVVQIAVLAALFLH